MDLPACWIMNLRREAVTAGVEAVIPSVVAEVLVFATVLPSDR